MGFKRERDLPDPRCNLFRYVPEIYHKAVFSVLTMLEHNGEYTAATTSCSIFAAMICRVSLR